MLVMSWLCRPLGASQGSEEGGWLMKRLLATLVILTGLIGSADAVRADGFDKGYAAYEAGDYAEAVKWFRKAAEQGDAIAQYNLALMYRDGEGVTQDDAEAVKWFRKAAEQGVANAQYNLALRYDKGKGVTQDYAEAAKWFRKAAKQGNASAQSNLGVMYFNGEGVTQDVAEALKWYRKAAEQGVAQAQHNLGVMYYKGYGVLQDTIAAHMWFNIAAVNGDKDGVTNRDIAAGKLSSADIVEAQKRAKRCMASDYKDCD
jgi:uncharacterized protein